MSLSVGVGSSVASFLATTYSISTDFIVAGRRLVAAAVVYPSSFAEPSFSYTLHGRSRTSFLYRRGDKISPALDSSLSDYIRSTAVSWAVVTAHADCPRESALELTIIRALERWVTRQHSLPGLEQTCVFLPLKKSIPSLPRGLKQVTGAKTWQVSAARALCRHSAAQE